MPLIPKLFFAFFLISTFLAASPVRVIENSQNHLLVEIEAPSVNSVQRRLLGEEYVEMAIPGFQKTLNPGAPQVPFIDIQVHVPNSSRLRYQVAFPKGTVTQSLAFDLAYTAFDPTHTGAKKVRKAVSEYTKDHGTEAAELLDDSFAGPDRLATFRVWPLKYLPQAKAVEVRPLISLHLSFDENENITRYAPMTGTPGEIAQHVAINPPVTLVNQALASPVDLIIAHGDYQMALGRLIALKRQAGREVRTHFISGLTNAQVKEIIVKEYQSAIPPTATLLVGSRAQIPMWSGSGDNRWTDFPYQNLDSGTVPDVVLGRIPARDFTELNNVLSKIIARELEPRKNDDVLLTAGQDNSLGCATNVTKVGSLVQAGASTITLIKKYKGQSSTDDIINAYNAEPNVIFYDGHGNATGMTEVPLVLSNLNRLINKAYPIILDIACLNANWSASRNFTETILSQSTGGVAGLLASGGSGYGHDFFQTIGDYMAKARQSLANDPSLNEIGRIILLSKIKHGSQDRSYWNYYGDPASTVWVR